MRNISEKNPTSNDTIWKLSALWTFKISLTKEREFVAVYSLVVNGASIIGIKNLINEYFLNVLTSKT